MHETIRSVLSLSILLQTRRKTQLGGQKSEIALRSLHNEHLLGIYAKDKAYHRRDNHIH